MRTRSQPKAPQYAVILFYKFFRVENPQALRDEQRLLAEKSALRGRMLIAREGVNATFEGTATAIKKYKAALKKDPIFADTVIKESAGTGHAFNTLSVKVRSEVVTLGAGEFDIEKETAPTITADELQKWYEKDEDFVVLDLRNDYETAVGQFEKTYDPKLGSFRDLPQKIDSLKALRDKKVVAVCTGGIRCEKATCFLKQQGFTHVRQLKDGIHSYLQKYPAQYFKGSLFVFDNRMVTPVVDAPDREVIGACQYCKVKCEDFYSDDSVRPSRKVICCASCLQNQPQLRSCVAA